MQGTVTQNKSILCKLYYKKITTSANLGGLNELFSRLDCPAILGGNEAKSEANRFSYWAAEPKEVFEFRHGDKEPFGKLQRILEKYRIADKGAVDLPEGIFCGGWLGYFSYELGRYIETVPETTIDDIDMPLIRLCFYDQVIAYDHFEGNFWLIALGMDSCLRRNDREESRNDRGESRNDIEDKLAVLEKLLAQSQQIAIPQQRCGDIDNLDFSQIRCNMSRDYYLEHVERIKRYIYDGQVYQVNFSQRFECDFDKRAIDIYHWQNQYNACSYSAYIDAGQFSIVSASPEMFVTVSDNIIKTKPIKGTRPRIGRTEKINDSNFDELLRSEKEQAELNMIIDLERNDLARICVAGTRKVIQQRTIEVYPTVFHAVAIVQGQLRSEVTFCDILKAMFPGGSITGAPKISAMEIIDEIEPTARGVYTGSIGFIGVDGNVCLNIAIRTIIIAGQKAYVQTGGGIVADSEPAAEWNETIIKARALLAGIKVVACSQ